MKKGLNLTHITNELKGASAYFRRDSKQEEPSSPLSSEEKPRQELEQPRSPTKKSSAQEAGSRDTTTPRYHDTTVDTMIPRHRDTIFETTRRAVKQLGKEAATHRFTIEEKKALRAIEHAYLDKNIRTSENELTRIAINYMLEDYRINEEKSIFARILELLNT